MYIVKKQNYRREKSIITRDGAYTTGYSIYLMLEKYGSNTQKILPWFSKIHFITIPIADTKRINTVVQRAR